MKETVASECNTARIALPAGASGVLDLAGQLVARSQLVWGEHCSECDYPRCYSSAPSSPAEIRHG